jgi:ankyrin repeat protein
MGSYYSFCWENNYDEAIRLINNTNPQTENKASTFIQKKKNAALRVFAYNGNIDAVKKLLELGANPNMRCRQTETIFINLSNGPDLSYTNYKSATVLAAMNNHSDIVKLFVDNNLLKNQNEIFYYFTIHRNMDMIKYLFDKGATVDAIINSEPYESPINAAIKLKMYDLIKYFIEKGLNVNNDKVSDYFGDCYNDEFMVGLLLENGFDVNNFCPSWNLKNDSDIDFFINLIPSGMNFSNKQWTWVLCMACKNGQENIVRTLTKYNVNIHDRCDLPFNYAAEHGHLNCLKILIDKEPSYLPNNKTLITTLLSLASGNKHSNIVEYFEQVGLFSLSEVLLFKAASDGNIDLVKFYISKNIDYHSENDYALRIALLNKHIFLAEYLVSIGCDLTAKDNFALYWAVMRGDTDVIDFLKKNGLNENNISFQFAKEKFLEHFEVSSKV